MAEAAAEEGRAAHLPEQPRKGFGPLWAGRWQEFAELLGEVERGSRRIRRRGSGFGAAAVEQGGNLGIGIDVDEAAAELVAVTDPDGPGVIFGALVAWRGAPPT